MPMTCFLQPVLSLREHRLVGVEALARMYDQGALLLPADFFKKGRKAAGDNWEVQCISSAFAQFMQIDEVLRSAMLLFVNIDPSWLFGKDNAYNDFLDLCKRFAISPTQIIIELAEASLGYNSFARRRAV
jgi:EAL domain-containing protein (putative c-di-GMP-specific phosphodiesterase class I)